MKKRNRVLLASALAGAGALAAYAFLVEPRWLEVTRRKIHVRGLPHALEGLRIALLSDLHAGGGTPLSLIRHACHETMQARPDLIALTGDFAADDAPNFRAVLGAVACLDAPLGVFAVPGNHDYFVGIERWHREVDAHPVIENLTNRAVMRDVGGARLCVAGVDDFTFGRPSLESLPPRESRDVTILLAHDPDQAERARREDDVVDLVLSGHTHGGQVRVPLIGAIFNPARNDNLYEQGLRRRPWTQVYISRGVGTVHLPVRFLCRPEVAILELTGAARPRLGPLRESLARARPAPRGAE